MLANRLVLALWLNFCWCKNAAIKLNIYQSPEIYNTYNWALANDQLQALITFSCCDVLMGQKETNKTSKQSKHKI